MVKDKVQKKHFADVKLGFSLQIPQGHSVEIKFEQSQCNFYLNQQVVEQIQLAKKKGVALEVPSNLLIYLWYCLCCQNHFIPNQRFKQRSNKITKSFFGFLINILRIFRSKHLQNQTSLQIGTTFNSYYHLDKLASDNYQEEDCILQSVVLFHGDVMQKIREDFILNNPQSAIVISAHYWLIEQLLGSLRNQVSLLVWELSSLFPAGLVVSKIDFINNINLVQQIFLLVIAWLGLATLIFAGRDFLFRLLKRSVAIKYQYLNLIAWFISCIPPAIAMIYTQDFQAINDTIFLVISVCIPLLLQPILSFIWPQVIKLILRRFL